MTNPYNDPNWLHNAVAHLQQQMDAKMNQMAASFRREMAARQQAADENLKNLAAVARSLTQNSSSNGIVRIDDLPGRRIPYDFIVDIPIGNNTTSVQQQSFTVQQEGPFVAVRRYATFQSTLQVQYTQEDGTQALFAGRSYGRYRPIHSAWDLSDGQSGGFFSTPNPMTTGTLVASLELPSSMSGFRTMEFDGRVVVENAGTGYPRQSLAVPTSMWTTQINSPQDLGCLDFFERGEVVTFKVQPNHVNNPPAGNVEGQNIFGAAGWPFLEGQYDKHEGIVTPEAFTVDDGDVTPIVDDPLTRLPDGILTIGFSGYRIQQPIGPLG